MTTRSKTSDASDLGQAEVQEKVSIDAEQGFHGRKVDPTPDEHYTVAGVLAGKPTPETDQDHAASVAADVHKGRR